MTKWKPTETTSDIANAILQGCIDDQWKNAGQLTPFFMTCYVLAMLTSTVKADREAAKAIIRKWKAFKD